MSKDNKKRHIISYENMSPELAEAFAEKYPKGFSDYLNDLNKYTKPDGTPFYAVLIGMNKVEASLIMGNRLWKVKRSYLNHVYDGEFTYISSKLKKGEKFEDQVTAENYVKALNSLSELTAYTAPEIKNKRDLKESFDEYLKQSDDEDLDAIVLDKSLAKGPKLEKQ